MEHELKTWPEYFQAICEGRKWHEIRKADRPFCCGDTLYLREWDPETQEYSGRSLRVKISYISCGGNFGIPPDLFVMSIVPIRIDVVPTDKGWVIKPHSES